MSILTVQSASIINQKEFEWKWRIENYDSKQKYVRKFSLDNDKCILRLEVDPTTQFRGFQPKWRFEKLGKSWSHKKFNLSISCDPDPIYFCDNECFDDILLNQMYIGGACPLSRMSTVKGGLVKEALTLKFEMTLRDGCKQSEREKLDEHIYLNENKKMLFSKAFSDYEFIIGGEIIKVHKTMLAARSEVFAKAFKIGDKEKEMELANIKNVTLGIFKKFILYLYTEKIPDVPIEDIQSFLYLADKYSVHDLKGKCEEILEDRLNDSNSVIAFNMAHQYKLNQDLIIGSFKFIQKKFAKINQKMDDEFINEPDAVGNLLNAYKCLLEGLKKRVKFSESLEETTA